MDPELPTPSALSGGQIFINRLENTTSWKYSDFLQRDIDSKECPNGVRKSLVTMPTLADGINRKSEFVIVAVCTTICVTAKCPDLLGIELYGIQ